MVSKYFDRSASTMRHARKRVRVALMQQFIYLLDRILRTSVRTVGACQAL